MKRLPVPAVSVGNLVVGGTGKTPTALWIAQDLLARGKRPAILSRGYGGSAGSGPLVVSDGERVFCDYQAAGDEPVMLARKAPGAMIVVGSDRYRSGLHAVERLGADCVILDDGFQHLKLHRDLNLLLMDSSRPFGNGRLLPAGTLREPRRAISRADLVLFTRWNQREGGDSERAEVEHRIGRSRTAAASHCFAGLASMDGGRAPDADDMRRRPALLVSGIAGAASFAEMVGREGFDVRGNISFADHYGYKVRDVGAIQERARELGASVVLTTEKDAVRFPPEVNEAEIPLFCVKIELRIEKGLDLLREALEDLFD